MKPYIPSELPIKGLKWDKVISLVGKAHREIALYQGLLNRLPNPYLYLKPLRSQEAIISSRIEGTYTTLQEIYEYELLQRIKKDREGDIREVINYRDAIEFGKEEIKRTGISLGLVKSMHQVLLNHTRGDEHKGRIRKGQNFVGLLGKGVEGAIYMPPPPEILVEYLENLEEYIKTEVEDPIIQLAIVHAQFELIHPFDDGNGRIGRILIPLFLYHKGLLTEPVFYMSESLEERKKEYYDNLNAISKKNDWEGWIVFFLEALITQAKKHVAKASRIDELYKSMKKRATEAAKTSFIIQALDALFKLCYFNTREFIEYSGIPSMTARRILESFTKNNILKEHKKTGLSSGKSRGGYFIFTDLYEIIK